MVEVKNYLIKGFFRRGPFKYKFAKEIRATSEKDALEKLYSIICSNHKVKRRDVSIVSLEEIPDEEVSDPLLRYMLEVR
ncbi:MAG: 50S ribosomal protein L18Ae [Candidatus Asgardarchaeia archaeon]